MDFALVVNILTAVTLITGFFFAAFEWRRTRLESRRQSQVLLIRSFDSPEFVKAMRLIVALPDGLGRQEVESALGSDGIDLSWYFAGIMESLGFLVFNREVDIRYVDQTLGGPVTITWRKLRVYADQVRQELGRDTMYEWFQWLAERREELERDEGRTAADEREREWKP